MKADFHDGQYDNISPCSYMFVLGMFWGTYLMYVWRNVYPENNEEVVQFLFGVLPNISNTHSRDLSR